MSVADKLTNIAENVPKVYEAGALSNHIAWWNDFTQNWTRTYYRYGFGSYGWNEKTFNPPQTIKPDNAQYMFQGANLMKFITKAQLDFSEATVMNGVFYACGNLEEVEEINCTKATSLNYLLYSCSKLRKTRLILGKNNTFDVNTFYRCAELQDFIVEGTIGQSGFNIQHSKKISLNSLKSILSACNLSDVSITVTLPSKCIDEQTDTNATIISDTEANTLYEAARSRGYSFVFNEV